MKIDYMKKKWTRDFMGSGDMIEVIGGKGSGKSTIGSLWFFQQCIHREGKGLFTLNTYNQMMKVYEEFLRPLFEKSHLIDSFNTKTGIMRLINGNEVHLTSAESAGNSESIQYDWWWGDEIQDYSFDALTTFYSRVRNEGFKIRLTAMPADPSSVIYSWLPKAGFKLYEVNIFDNPDAKFAQRYHEQLLNVYQTKRERDRWIYGKRVSLTGIGIFNIDDDNIGDVQYNINNDIYFVWDFNVAYRAVTVWQVVGLDNKGYPVIGCLKSYKMQEDTVAHDALKLAREWRRHAGRVFLHGDASGASRTAAASVTMWAQVHEVFKRVFDGLRYIVPSSNPAVKDTIEVLNWGLTKKLVLFSESSRDAFMSVQAATADKYGEIDKSRDYDANSTHTHLLDTVRYISWVHHSRYIKRNVSKMVKIYGA